MRPYPAGLLLLLYVLRNTFGLHGPKFGCGLGQCGTCTVLVDSRATRSCTLPVSRAEGRAVTTLEGLGTPEQPSRLQAAFIAEQAAQCGYCTNGMIKAPLRPVSGYSVVGTSVLRPAYSSSGRLGIQKPLEFSAVLQGA